MTNKEIWCFVYNPTRQSFSRHRLEDYVKSNQKNYFDGFDPALAEVVLDTDCDQQALLERTKKFTDYRPDSPPLQ